MASSPLGPLSARAASVEPGAQETAIINNAKAFVDAFEKGDAKAVAVFWAEDGDYADLDGRHLRGRPAIEDAFKDFFKENKGLKLCIDVKSVRFVTPEVAIEDGTSSVIPPDGTPPSQSSYAYAAVCHETPSIMTSGFLSPAGFNRAPDTSTKDRQVPNISKYCVVRSDGACRATSTPNRTRRVTS